MEKALGSLFDQYMSGDLSDEQRAWFEARMPAYRRENIARTETTRAAGVGSHTLFSGWGAEGHEWLTAMDGRQRDTHGAANGQVVPMNEPFTVGGYQMMHPGDPNAPAEEVCECRCAELPVLVMPARQEQS